MKNYSGQTLQKIGTNLNEKRLDSETNQTSFGAYVGIFGAKIPQVENGMHMAENQKSFPGTRLQLKIFNVQIVLLPKAR